MSIASDTSTWLDLRKGSTVILKDEQTLVNLMSDPSKRLESGLTCIVQSVKKITVPEVMTFVIAELDEENLTLIVKVVDDFMDIKVVYVPDDFEPGSRQDQINAERFWLFEEPNDVNDFVPYDLDFADNIPNDNHNFVAKTPTLYITDRRPFTQIREWFCADDGVENPELIVIEEGGVDEDGESIPSGGYVQFYQGTNVSPGDVEVLPV